MQPPVLEREERTSEPKRREHSMVSDGAESEDCTESGHCVDLGDEELPAVDDFALLGLVERRNTAHRIGNAHAPQFETVVGTRVISALGKAEFTQGLIQEPTGIPSR